MGTEKFIAFKEDGSAYRLKGRILRFLDNEPVSEADKTNIRSTLSVPASAEGLTPANNLSDLDSAATARTNLSVNSKDEDAQANALKVTAPALYFNGSSSVVEVADDDKLSFTDGTDDLPFTISAWVNMADATNFGVVSKYGATDPVKEWLFYTAGTDKLGLLLRDLSGNNATLTSDTALTSYEGQWIHLAATYAGSGPSSDVAFANAADAGTMELYLNGVMQTNVTRSSSGYTGMSNTAQAVDIGRYFGSVEAKGHIRSVKIFNRSLTASEVAELARGNDLGFSEEWAGALGGVFTQDSTPSGEFAGVNLTDADEAGPIGGKSNVLKLTVNTASGVLHYATFSGASGTAGKRLRLKCNAYVPSANSNADGVWIYQSSGSAIQEESITPDTWVPLEFEFVSNGNVMVVAMLDGASSSFADAGSDDILYLADLTVTEIGCLADFRAERYDTSTSKLYDISDNAFVGTGTSVTLTGREVPVYETGTWTPGLEFGGASVGLTASVAEGRYTRTGDVVTLTGSITLTAKGSSTGSARITGLPFTSRNESSSRAQAGVPYAINMASLTSAITAIVQTADTDISLWDWGATGVTSLTDANFTDTSSFRFSSTYQIQ